MDRNRLTQSVIVGLATLIAALGWSGLKSFLYDGGNWLWPSLAFLALIIFLVLNWLLVKLKSILLITLLLVTLSFLLVFNFQIEYFVFLIIGLLLMMLGSWRAIDERESRLKIRPGKIFRRGLPLVLTGLILIITSAYYFSPLSPRGQDEIEIPRPLFDILTQPLISSTSFKPSLDQLSEQLGIAFENTTLLENVLYSTVNQEINKKSQAYKQYIPFSLSVGVFFALKAISIPLMWLVILIGSLIFKLLVLVGAVKIQEQAVLKEIIEV